jgi:hypothetical protein
MPMSDADAVDPATLAAEASAAAGAADAGDAADAMADAADADDGPTRARALGRALLSTRPAESPDDYPDAPPALAHAMIGVKKVAHSLGVPDVDRGEPAIYNLGMAVKLAGGRAADAADGDDGDRADEGGVEQADAEAVEVGRDG